MSAHVLVVAVKQEMHIPTSLGQLSTEITTQGTRSYNSVT